MNPVKGWWKLGPAHYFNIDRVPAGQVTRVHGGWRWWAYGRAFGKAADLESAKREVEACLSLLGPRRG